MSALRERIRKLTVCPPPYHRILTGNRKRGRRWLRYCLDLDRMTHAELRLWWNDRKTVEDRVRRCLHEFRYDTQCCRCGMFMADWAAKSPLQKLG